MNIFIIEAIPPIHRHKIYIIATNNIIAIATPKPNQSGSVTNHQEILSIPANFITSRKTKIENVNPLPIVILIFSLLLSIYYIIPLL